MGGKKRLLLWISPKKKTRQQTAVCHAAGVFLIESHSTPPPIQLCSRVASKTSACRTDTHMTDPDEDGAETDMKTYTVNM